MGLTNKKIIRIDESLIMGIGLNFSKEEVVSILGDHLSNEINENTHDFFEGFLTVRYNSEELVDKILLNNDLSDGYIVLYKDIPIFSLPADDISKLLNKTHSRMDAESRFDIVIDDSIVLWRDEIFDLNDYSEEWFEEFDIETKLSFYENYFFKTVSKYSVGNIS